VRSHAGVALKAPARKRLILAYERRMDQLATPPVSGTESAIAGCWKCRRVSLGRVCPGRIMGYPSFRTRCLNKGCPMRQTHIVRLYISDPNVCAGVPAMRGYYHSAFGVSVRLNRREFVELAPPAREFFTLRRLGEFVNGRTGRRTWQHVPSARSVALHVPEPYVGSLANEPSHSSAPIDMIRTGPVRLFCVLFSQEGKSLKKSDHSSSHVVRL